MIKDIDILHEITSMLNTNFKYGVFIEENNKEVLVPTFFISLSHLDSNTQKYWNEKFINIYITYTNKAVKIEELLEMQNSLDELFDMYITVKDVANYKHSLVFDKKTFNRQEDFMTMCLTATIIDDKTTTFGEDTANSTMENLTINMTDQ